MSKASDLYLGTGRKIIITLSLVFAFIFLVLLYYLYTEYRIEEVTVTGNRHYTREQIEDMVFEGPLDHNSLILGLKYSDRKINDIPFIETMDVQVVSAKSVAISVYEKSIAGCVQYLDHYMFFDKDGIIVECSSASAADIPIVRGLSFDHMVLHEKLELDDENKNIFSKILNITQLLSKYQINTTQIYFEPDGNMTLYFGNARVKLGTMDNIDEKMLRLKEITPSLIAENLSGVLYMDGYVEGNDNDNITFQRDDVKRHQEVSYDMEEGVSENSIVSENIIQNKIQNEIQNEIQN